MPAAAEHRAKPPQTPCNAGHQPAAHAATPFRGRPPLAAVDDRSLIHDLVGHLAALAIGDTPVGVLLEASPDQLTRLGLKPAARRRLLASAELARRFQPAVKPSGPVRTARDLLPHLAVLRAGRTEALGVLTLDVRCCVLGGLAVVAEGGLMHVAVAAREVYGPALERRAAAIVIAHNHQSGVAEPSAEDVSFTQLMGRAGIILGVRLLDHMIVARRGYFSFREAGLWDDSRGRQASPFLGVPVTHPTKQASWGPGKSKISWGGSGLPPPC